MANHNIDEKSSYYDPIDHWTCGFCDKTISSSRPPVFNPDNCCCAEAASYAKPQDIQSSPYNQTFHQYEPAPQTYHVPESNASSNLSVPCPEGPEREDPNESPNRFLSLGPEPGFNESQARRSSSFHADMPYQLRRFLGDQNLYYGEEAVEEEKAEPPMMKFLPQGVLHTQSSMKQHPSSRRSKPTGNSGKSGQSSWSGEASHFSHEVDPITGIGSWTDKEGDLYCGESYPMVMSGFTEWNI